MVSKKNVDVLLTGFGAFEKITTNPATLIVKLLNDHVETFEGCKIRIRTYPQPLDVVYDRVFELAPKLFKEFPDIDFFIHVGVHEHASNFRIETRARKGPYERKDVNGRSFGGVDDGVWPNLPDELFARVDVPAVVDMVKADLKTNEIAASEDAGLFLCEFLFYNSLVQTQLSRDKSTKIAESLFFHVPPGLSAEEIEQGRLVLLDIIRALV